MSWPNRKSAKEQLKGYTPKALRYPTNLQPDELRARDQLLRHAPLQPEQEQYEEMLRRLAETKAQGDTLSKPTSEAEHRAAAAGYTALDYANAFKREDLDPPRRSDLLKLHLELSLKARDTMRAKNQDYASTADPFRNFRQFGLLGVLVRMSDKLSRLRTFEERGLTSVKDESIQDTIEDLINYAVIFLAMSREEVSKI